MARKIDSPTTASRPIYVLSKRQRVRKMLITVTAWSFHTVCLIYATSEIGWSQGRLAATPMFRPSADCAFPQKL
jgi:hypothetical protein